MLRFFVPMVALSCFVLNTGCVVNQKTYDQAIVERDAARSDLKLTQDARDTKNEQLTALQSEHTAVVAERDTLKNKLQTTMADAEQAMVANKAALAELTKDVEQTQKLLKDEKAASAKAKADADAEREAMKKAAAESDAKLAAMSTELTAAKAELQKNVTALTKATAALETELKASRTAQTELVSLRNGDKNKADESAAKIAAAEKASTELAKKLSAAEKTIKDLETKLSKKSPSDTKVVEKGSSQETEE